MRYFLRLAQARSALQLSQSKIGEILGVSQNTYCNYEKGNREISIDKIERLSHIGISPEWLINGTIDENIHYEITVAMQWSGYTPTLLSEKTGVSVGFVNDIMDKKLSPSKEWFAKAMNSMGYEAPGNSFDRLNEEMIKYKALHPDSEVIKKLEEKLDDLTTERDALVEIVDNIKKEKERLYDEMMTQKGRADAFENMVRLLFDKTE